MKTPEQIDPDWARYAETVLSFGGEHACEIDLRENLPVKARDAFRARGFNDTFAILTAHDPCGRDLTPEENKVLQNRLESELKSSNVNFVRVDACSVDRRHCECSLAIDVTQKSALEIAARYEQMAIFWFDGNAMWLLGAVVESDPIRLPRTT